MDKLKGCDVLNFIIALFIIFAFTVVVVTAIAIVAVIFVYADEFYEYITCDDEDEGDDDDVK